MGHLSGLSQVVSTSSIKMARVPSVSHMPVLSSNHAGKNKGNFMNIKNTNHRPWLDPKGKVYCNETIKEISKSWDAETWELYLQQTVDVERSENEVLLDKYQQLLEEVSEGVRWSSCTVPQHVITQIHLALRALAPQQKKIIAGSFWDGLSERELAEKLQIAKTTVNESKKISLSKIKDFLEKDPTTLSYLIGGNKNLAPRKRSRDEQVRQVYAIDLNGSYIK
jgi:hypothetical protein